VVFGRYRAAWKDLLTRIHLIPRRDPLSEFSELLVAELVGGQLADRRVQRGFDVVGPAGERIQVKHLANPGDPGAWVDEHLVRVDKRMDAYAIVFFTELRPTSVVLFNRQKLWEVANALGKSHANQKTTLQLTRRDLDSIFADSKAFTALGVRAFVESGSGWDAAIAAARTARRPPASASEAVS
jgi:hypothetical protein